MTKRTILATSFASAALFTSVGIALAADQTFLPAAVCQAGSNILFGSNGGATSEALSGFAGYVSCGIGTNQALDTNDDIRVYFDDVNNLNQQNFGCGTMEVDEDWSSIITGGTRYGCGTAGGCAADPGVFTGANYLTITDIRHGGAYSTWLLCTFPHVLNGASSTMKSIWLDEQ